MLALALLAPHYGTEQLVRFVARMQERREDLVGLLGDIRLQRSDIGDLAAFMLSLLDESQRYSRLLLLMGSAWTMAATLLIRVALSAKGVKGYTLRTHARGATLAVGTSTETARIRELYASMGISTDKLTETDDTDTRHLQDLIRIEHAEEVVFCGCDIRHVIELMAHLRTTGVEYRIAPRESDYVIGSETVLTPDDLYIASLDTIPSGCST